MRQQVNDRQATLAAREFLLQETMSDLQERERRLRERRSELGRRELILGKSSWTAVLDGAILTSADPVAVLVVGWMALELRFESEQI